MVCAPALFDVIHSASLAAPRLKDETTESYDRHRSSPSRISPFTTFRTASRVVSGRPIHRTRWRWRAVSEPAK